MRNLYVYLLLAHYNDVIMTTMASQITSLTVVYSTVYSDADQRKHQSSASLAFVWGIHRDRWIPRTKGQLRGKCFHLMTSSCKQRQAELEMPCRSCDVNMTFYVYCSRPITADSGNNVGWDHKVVTTRHGGWIQIVNYTLIWLLKHEYCANQFLRSDVERYII